MGTASSTENNPENAPKKSFYRRYQDSKASRSDRISEEDMLKYTGKTKTEINDWSKDTPGVAGNRAAGTLAMGATSGLGGVAAGDGYGGWGPDSHGPLKYPPRKNEESKG
jgi:hypothetical protein